MTFVKIHNKESELSAIRKYALLKSYIRDRNRTEKLNDFNIHEQSPSSIEHVKDEKNNGTGDDVHGGAILAPTVNEHVPIPPSSKKKRKKMKKSKVSTPQDASVSINLPPPKKTGKKVKKLKVSTPQDASVSINPPPPKKTGKKVKKLKEARRTKNDGVKKLLYTTVKPKFLTKKTLSNVHKSAGGAIPEFLPSDVTSLREQLSYLIAEYKAGNKSLKNHIAAILKNLHDRKIMTKQEYNTEINSIFR